MVLQKPIPGKDFSACSPAVGRRCSFDCKNQMSVLCRRAHAQPEQGAWRVTIARALECERRATKTQRKETGTHSHSQCPLKEAPPFKILPPKD